MIIDDLNKDESYKSSIDLDTDYMPLTRLKEACERALGDKYQLYKIFPQKTLTHIDLNNKKTQLSLRMNFKGPRF